MAPVPIEDDIKAELSEVVSQAMLVGINFTKEKIASINYWICKNQKWR